MLGVAVLLAMASMPGQSIVVALFNQGFRDDLGLSITQLSAAYTIGTILAALPLSLIGKAADRFGLRVTVGVIAVAFAAALVYQSRVESLIALGVGFFLVRLLGQGSIGMMAGHTISMWFERTLGRVHSILAIGGFAGGSVLVPLLAAWLIAETGWRTALVWLAALVLVLVIPPVLTVFRNKPEDIGQHLDGDPAEHRTHDTLHGGTPPPGDPAFTTKQAATTLAYWIMVPCMLMSGLVGTALLFHMGALLSSAGITGTPEQLAGEVAKANVAFPIAFGSATLLFGWLADKVPARVLLPLGPLLLAASCAVCTAVVTGRVAPEHTVPIMAVGMGVFGTSQAIVVAVCNPTIARYFGRTHHGSIRGSIATMSVIGTGIGPLLAGWAFTAANASFAPILIVFAACGVPLAIGGAFLTKPMPPSERDRTPDPDDVDPPGML